MSANEKEKQPQFIERETCNICLKQVFSLKRHSLEHEKTTKCNQCEFSSVNEYNLQRHIKRMHTDKGTETVSCELCLKTFKTNKSKKLHVLSVHEGLKPHKCNLCDKSYSDATPLRIHKEVAHTESGYFPCESCDKDFTHDYHLKQHVRVNHLTSEDKGR